MLNNPLGPKGLSIARRLNLQRKNGEAGYHKTNRDEVRLFKQRIAAGVEPEVAREGTKITARMVPDILAGRTWASVVLLVFMCLVLMGNSCDTDQRNNAYCQGLNYPYCDDVPFDYECLCLSRPSAVTAQEADGMRYLNGG